MNPQIKGASGPRAGCSLCIASEELSESWVLLLLFLELINPLFLCLVYILGQLLDIGLEVFAFQMRGLVVDPHLYARVAAQGNVAFHIDFHSR